MSNIVPNGHKIGDYVTLVGHKFDASNDSTLPSHLQDATRQRAGKAPFSMDRKREEADRLNKRYAVAETCKCGRPLIAEEVLPHKLSHAPDSTVKTLVATVMQHPPEVRKQTLEFLKEVLG